MNPQRSRVFVFATVLAALFGCNSPNHNGSVAIATTTAPATPTEHPFVLNRAQQRQADEMRTALYYLASDDLEGRGVLTDGLNKAADYIAETYRRAGLRPLPGLDDYFQPFMVSVGTEVGPETRLAVGDHAFAADEDFVPMGLSAEGTFDGPVAFAGYAISADEFQYDDFAGIDVKGKVVLALRYEPSDDEGKSRFDPTGRSTHATFNAKAAAAAERDALALLIVNPPSDSDADRLVSMGRSAGSSSTIPVLQVTRETADKLLKMAGTEDLAALQKRIDSTGKPHSFVLDQVAASGQVDLKREQREVKNVIAFVPGRGAGRDEYVIVGAHYDHLGRGETGSLSMLGRREIHNGADDNASGTVAMLELAKHYAKANPQRSIIFIAFTAEERGLLGSAHFVNEPPVPLDKVVAMINLDMVGRLAGDTLEVGGSGTAAEFEAIIAAVDEQSQLRLKPASSRVGGQGGLGPSDHASFARKKIPVMFLWTGNHVDYHRPTDTADKVNYEGMVMIVDATRRTIDRLLVMPRTQYVDTFDRSSMAMGAMRVRLGIMPDYSSEDNGVKVGSAFPDTPAARAGIKDGDVIVQIGQTPIATMEDYMSAMNKHKPGDTVTIGVMRNGQRLNVEAKFAAPRRG